MSEWHPKLTLSVSRNRQIGKYCWKETKKRKGKGHGGDFLRHVLFQCQSRYQVIIPSCDCPPISLIPLPSVWLGWPWSPKSRSSPLKIRLLISPPVECVMPLHGYIYSHIILLVNYYLSPSFQDSNQMHNGVTQRGGPVFWYTALALASAWLNVRASYLGISECFFVTQTRYDEASHFDGVNIHPDPATKCSILAKLTINTSAESAAVPSKQTMHSDWLPCCPSSPRWHTHPRHQHVQNWPFST